MLEFVVEAGEDMDDALGGGEGVRAFTLSFSDNNSKGPTWILPTPDAVDDVPPIPNASALKTYRNVHTSCSSCAHELFDINAVTITGPSRVFTGPFPFPFPFVTTSAHVDLYARSEMTLEISPSRWRGAMCASLDTKG